MQIENKEEYKNIELSSLGLSPRSINPLRRAGINTLYQLVEEQERLGEIRGIGPCIFDQIMEVLEEFVVSDAKPAEEDTSAYFLPGEVLERSVKDLDVSQHVCKRLSLVGIRTIREALDVYPEDFQFIMLPESYTQLIIELEKLKALGADYFARPGMADPFPYPRKGFDFPAIDILKKDFGMKLKDFDGWYGLSFQEIKKVLNRCSSQNYAPWTGREMTRSERDILLSMIREQTLDYFDETVICRCLNNRKDDLACLFIYEEETSCFFLTDLPEDLRELAVAANFHRYSEEELSGDANGRIVHVMGKPFFLPDQPERFADNARIRRISRDDYARFVSGCPLGNSRSITDEQIRAFFDENLVDGRVCIPVHDQNRWIRKLATENGYSLEDFIEFFGYKAGSCEKGLQSHPDEILERDMQVRPVSEEAPLEEKVFARYPLIGSRILSQKTLEALNQNVREYIDTVLAKPRTRVTDRAEMQIAMALVNCAKNWKSEENPNFWNYITLQFGYRDAAGTVVRLLKRSLERAMKRNRRLFIEDANGRSFKSTVVIHAFSTRKSWMAVFDFLFDFYKNNLDWKLIPDDPLLGQMVRLLQKKLAGESPGDAEITVSYHVYLFQEGIRKLILIRPKFTEKLFESLIGRIDALVNSREMPVKTYEEQLCEEWFKEKITAIAGIRKSERKKSSSGREVTIDYSRIRVKYVLHNENRVQLVLPDIRLKCEDVHRAVLEVSYDETVALERNLGWYGNELGKTLTGLSVDLPEYTGGKGCMNIRVRILCDGEAIFDSKNTMARRVLMFSGETEVKAAQVHMGSYAVVLPAACVLEAENTDMVEFESFGTPGLKAYFLELHEGYLLSVDGNLLSSDSGNSREVRVIAPPESDLLPRVAVEDGECSLAYRDSVCRIILGNADYRQQFFILKNGKRVEFSDLEDAGNDRTFLCPLSGDGDFCQIQVINLGSERTVFDRSFMLAATAECGFNREFYYARSDYREARFFAKIDDYREEASFTAEDEEVRLPFRNGELHAEIPKVRITESTGEWLNERESAWYALDIPQNSLLGVESPAGTTVQFFVGGKDILYDGKGPVTLGNVIQSLSGSDLDMAPVEMLITGKKQTSRYVLAQVCYSEVFLCSPRFWYADGKIFWSGGGSFVGKRDRIFTLTLVGEDEGVWEFTLNADTPGLEVPENMPLGNYRYEIGIQTGSLFRKVKKVLARGDCVIGDPNLLRFKGRRIDILAITDEFNEEAGHISVLPCHIDQIEFVGMEDTSEGISPVYKGVLYTLDREGERHDFSFDQYVNDRGIARMMVNPVRIVYLGDSSLCITDPEGDGLYYCTRYEKYSGETVHMLTDREYTRETRHQYSTADLFMYRTERI